MTMELVPPQAAGSPEGYENALRQWRAGAAREASVPAYVVLNDRELMGIVDDRPRTLAELARCKGVGPVRLERWGDEILGVLDAAEGDAEAATVHAGSAR